MTQQHVMICRICGSEENLTRHHIVPKQHLKKKHNQTPRNQDFFNIVILCYDCHTNVEGAMPKVKWDGEKIVKMTKKEAQTIKLSYRRQLRRSLDTNHILFIENTVGNNWLDYYYPLKESPWLGP